MLAALNVLECWILRQYFFSCSDWRKEIPSVGDDSKLKLSYSTEKTAKLLEMLKSSKDANKTMRSIQTIIMDGKRDKQIDHPKTIFTLDSDKQKNFKENTESKNKNLSQAQRRIQSKTPKRKRPNEKHTAKIYSTNVTLDVNFSIWEFLKEFSLCRIFELKNKNLNAIYNNSSRIFPR